MEALRRGTQEGRIIEIMEKLPLSWKGVGQKQQDKDQVVNSSAISPLLLPVP